MAIIELQDISRDLFVLEKSWPSFGMRQINRELQKIRPEEMSMTFDIDRSEKSNLYPVNYTLR